MNFAPKLTRRALLSATVPLIPLLHTQKALAQNAVAQNAVGPSGPLPNAREPYSGVSYRNYSRCLPDYLHDLAWSLAKARQSELTKLVSPELVIERQKWARQTFWRLIGGGFEKTPLNAKVTGTLDRIGYQLQKVTYESRPGFFVTANLYIPARGRKPFPAVLFQMGHAPAGKAYPAYQRCCQGLARLGYLVLAFDPIGQGERIAYPDSSFKRSRLGSPMDEHNAMGKQLILSGSSAVKVQLWDAVRSLDYLASHPLADPRRLATTGQSGGATISMYLACVDDRISAAAIMSGNTEKFAIPEFEGAGSTDDAEQDLIYSAPAGFDRWDCLYPIAPKPLLISVSDKDFFGTYSPDYVQNGWDEFQKLKKVYQTLGKSDHLSWSSTPLPHGLSYDSRLALYSFLNHWFKGQDRITEEPATKPETEEVLWATESGSVIRSLKSQTPFQMEQKPIGKQAPVTLDRLLRLERQTPQRLTVLKRASSLRGVEIEALEVQSGNKMWVPLWLFLPPDKASVKPLIVLLEPNGRNGQWHEDETYQTLAAEGFAVAVPDVRGLGDLTPEFGNGNPRYAKSHGEEEDYAWAALILGRPMVGQRTNDVLAVVRALRLHPPVQNKPLILAAQGKLTIPAQFASALEPNIQKLYLSGGLAQYRSLLETENFGHPFANFIPNICNQQDLPEVTSSMGKRKVVMAGMLDGGGRRIDVAAVRKLYERNTNLEVLDQAQWNIDALRKFAIG